MIEYKYETQGGTVTPGLEYSQLSEHLIRAREHCLMLGHLAAEDGDDLLRKGWHAIAEYLKLMNHQVTLLAQGKLLKGSKR